MDATTKFGCARPDLTVAELIALQHVSTRREYRARVDRICGRHERSTRPAQGLQRRPQMVLWPSIWRRHDLVAPQRVGQAGKEGVRGVTLAAALAAGNGADRCLGEHDEVSGIKFDIDTNRSAADKYRWKGEQPSIDDHRKVSQAYRRNRSRPETKHLEELRGFGPLAARPAQVLRRDREIDLARARQADKGVCGGRSCNAVFGRLTGVREHDRLCDAVNRDSHGAGEFPGRAYWRRQRSVFQKTKSPGVEGTENPLNVARDTYGHAGVLRGEAGVCQRCTEGTARVLRG